MFSQKWLQEAWFRFNSESDDAVFEVIRTKYYGLFQITPLYPNFKGLWLYISWFQLLSYVLIVAYHWLLLIISTPKMSEINFVLFSQTIHYTVLTTLSMVILVYGFSRRPVLARFHKIINGGVYDYKENDGEIFQHFDEEVQREWKRLLVVPMIVAVSAGFGLVLGPILDIYGTFSFDSVEDRTISFNIPVPMVSMIDTSEPNRRNLATLLQLATGGVVGLIFATGALGYICVTQTVTREFRVLLNAVDNIENRARKLHLQRYGFKVPANDKKAYQIKTYNQCLDACFKKLYEHYFANISLANDMTTLLGFPNFVAFGGGPLVIGMAFLATTTAGSQLPGTTLTSLALCFIEVVYMYLFTSLGQRITDLTEEFRLKLYSTKWYYFEKNLKIKLNILQMATLTPYVLYAPFKSMPSTLETLGSVLNSAYSFYNLMLAMN